MANIDPKDLLATGAHFGHKTSNWHPKMAPYIYGVRGEVHIIDLVKTAPMLEEALDEITKTVAAGKEVLLVGTKRQAIDPVRETAESTGQPYVVERWLGGMMTNWNTVGTQIKYLVDQESKMASGELANKFNKLEVQRFQEEIDAMNVLYGGIKELSAKPGVVVIFDITHDQNAVKEATKLKLPIVGVCDTNANPTGITFPIPCNDDAIKTLQLLADYFKAAVMRGKAKSKTPEKSEDQKD